MQESAAGHAGAAPAVCRPPEGGATGSGRRRLSAARAGGPASWIRARHLLLESCVAPAAGPGHGAGRRRAEMA
eukprot:5923595-Pyramimonas_sp.AAC.1